MVHNSVRPSLTSRSGLLRDLAIAFKEDIASQQNAESHETARLTFFGAVSYCCVHIRKTEDIAHDLRHRHRNIVQTHASLSCFGGVKHGALEMGVSFVVQLAFMLDQCSNSLVCVHTAEFEIGYISLVEVAEVLRYAQSCWIVL